MKKQHGEAVKMAAIEAKIQGETLQAISRETGVSPTSLKEWFSKAAKQKDAVIVLKKQRTEAEKTAILAEYAQCRSSKTISEKYNVSKSTLFRWMKKAKDTVVNQSGKIYTATEIHKIKRELIKLRLKNEIFRICRCSSASSIPEKVEAVTHMRDKYTPFALCRALNLSRATYYRVSLNQKKKTQYEAFSRSDILTPP